jgi:hypothetical protein
VSPSCKNKETWKGDSPCLWKSPSCNYFLADMWMKGIKLLAW